MFERTQEHLYDIKQLKTNSHLLRHLVDKHEHEDWEQVTFGAKIIRSNKSRFERRIAESVMIQGNRSHKLLNLKAEYNRCAIPRLVTKLGEKELDKWQKSDKEDQESEDKIESKIRMLRKTRNKNRQAGVERTAPPPPPKRRRLDQENYEPVNPNRAGKPKKPNQEKRHAEAGGRDQGSKRQRVGIERYLEKNLEQPSTEAPAEVNEQEDESPCERTTGEGTGEPHDGVQGAGERTGEGTGEHGAHRHDGVQGAGEPEHDDHQ